MWDTAFIIQNAFELRRSDKTEGAFSLKFKNKSAINNYDLAQELYYCVGKSELKLLFRYFILKGTVHSKTTITVIIYLTLRLFKTRLTFFCGMQMEIFLEPQHKMPLNFVLWTFNTYVHYQRCWWAPGPEERVWHHGTGELGRWGSRPRGAATPKPPTSFQQEHRTQPHSMTQSEPNTTWKRAEREENC